MKKVSIIYFSSTGNTEDMAQAIAEGVRDAGGSVNIIDVESASTESITGADIIALGCPSMGSEELDDSMDVFVDAISGDISGKPVALFGSYDWGDGEWMRDWYDRIKGYGAEMVQDEGLICNLTPEGEDIESCKELGNKIAS